MVTKVAPHLPGSENIWPPQGQWTYDDFLRLPDDGRRYEIIEGILYTTKPPSYEHQFTITEIVCQLANFVREYSLGVVLPAPFEVHLPGGIAKPVQPDVLYIAAAHQPRPGDQVFEGAPDLIVEVISPGSVRVDQFIKFGIYERAGVREYWLANPKTRSIEVYTLPADGTEYTLLGQFGSGEKLRSGVLAGLEIAVDSLFTPIST